MAAAFGEGHRGEATRRIGRIRERLVEVFIDIP
jgi:hypothetical protein